MLHVLSSIRCCLIAKTLGPKIEVSANVPAMGRGQSVTGTSTLELARNHEILGVECGHNTLGFMGPLDPPRNISMESENDPAVGVYGMHFPLESESEEETYSIICIWRRPFGAANMAENL
ncbi:hypothetical protein H920_05831 [Fukomys damarensis]|uniref:Uncharacterized protein n=1 Tax=Fukomys damarensis TaxID=885580 RepID=A0A091DL19_FUKDA|nr:hypothetical protein H920_05831 [Fukomys damarensis]